MVFSRQWPFVGVEQRVPAGQVPLELPPLRQRPFVAEPAQESQMSLLQLNSCQLLQVAEASLVEMPPEPTQTWVAEVVFMWVVKRVAKEPAAKRVLSIFVSLLLFLLRWVWVVW